MELMSAFWGVGVLLVGLAALGAGVPIVIFDRLIGREHIMLPIPPWDWDCANRRLQR
jgi:hypothetical protein